MTNNSIVPIGHERQVTFFPINGHNHDGENSTIVELQPGQVGLQHLDPSLIEFLKNLGEGEGSVDEEGSLIPVPDLEFETNSIGPGASVTGSLDWTGICVVRWMRIIMSTETECTITFYHSATFADEDREFRARRCSNKFLWEGPWVHFDEDETKKIHYKIENTGTAAARFNITLKSGTLVANGYANFVSGIQKQGDSNAAFINTVILAQGPGIKITPDPTSNTFTFESTAAEIVTRDRYALVPKGPVGFTSSATTSGSLTSNFSSTTNVAFGTGLQWIRLDFGNVFNAGRIVVVPYGIDNRTHNNVKIEASSDGNNWATLMSTQSTIFATTQGIVIETPAGYPVRYVRLWMQGNSINTTNNLTGAVLYAISDKIGTG